MRRTRRQKTKTMPRGLTLVEIVLGAAILAATIAALLQMFVGQVVLAEHYRNLSWAINDADRVVEELRKQHSGSTCLTPGVTPPTGFASWDAWLSDTSSGGGGKSIQPNPATNELVVVSPSVTPPAPVPDPLTLTVAVCWRHRNRTVGECTWNGTALVANPGAGGDPAVTESPVMFTTAMTCRE